MTHSLNRFHTSAPLRAVLVVLCASAMLLGSTLALANSDCLASCIAGGSSGSCAPANGVPLVYPSAQAALARAPDTRAPLGTTAPPPLPPPIA